MSHQHTNGTANGAGNGISNGAVTGDSFYHHEKEYSSKSDDSTHKELNNGKVIRFGIEENVNITAEDWNRRWDLTGTGRWQLSDVHPFLLKYASFFRDWQNRSQKRILIPFSGKSIDLFWFHQQGVKQVIGIESSVKAIIELFTSQHVQTYRYERVTETIGKYSILDDQIVIYQSDLFDPELTADLLGGAVDWVWDRAAIVAIHWVDHPRYVQKIRSLQKRIDNSIEKKASTKTVTKDETPHYDFDILLGAYDHNQHRGPPFNTSPQYLQIMYGQQAPLFVQLDELDVTYSGWRNGGFEYMLERAYGISYTNYSNLQSNIPVNQPTSIAKKAAANDIDASIKKQLAECSTNGVCQVPSSVKKANTSNPSFDRKFEVKTTTAGIGTHSQWAVDGRVVDIDAAKAFGGNGEGVGPLPTILTSLASCQQVTANVILNTDPTFTKNNKKIDSIDWISVSGEFNSEVLEKGVTSEEPATWKRVVLQANVKSNLNAAELSHLIKETERRCPLTALFVKAGTEVKNEWKNA